MALVFRWGLNAPLRQLLRLGAFVCIVACRSSAHDTETDRAAVTLASPKLFPNTVASAPPRQAQPAEQAAPVAVVSQRDLVARFVQKDLSRMTPDEVTSHFATVSQLDRVTFPERLSLEAHSPNEQLSVAYALAPDGSWHFASADLSLRAGEQTESDATFRETEKQLRKLGKPKTSNDGMVWKRPNRQELWLTQLKPAQSDGTWEVALQLAEPTR